MSVRAERPLGWQGFRSLSAHSGAQFEGIMKKRLSNLQVGCAGILLLLMFFAVASAARAQSAGYTKPGSESRYDRTKAVPEEHSRAQQEADRMVSLSADKIVSLLSSEPGLFLECKRILVRAAFAQGQVIGPDDLTDDAVFRQVREDQNVRILFTKEIENRFYVRAKPTREELERDWEEKRIRVPDQAEVQLEGTATLKSATNEEQAYWLRHERDLDRSIPMPRLNPNGNPATPAAPSATPDEGTRDLIARSLDNSDTTSNGPLFGPGADQTAMLMRSGLSGGGSGAGGMGSDDERSSMGQGFDSNSGGAGGSLTGMPPGFDPLESEADATLGSGKDLFGSAAGAPSGMDTAQTSAYYARYRARLLQGREKQPVLQHRTNPYADVPALYDLYAQYSRRTPKLDRFGIDIFQNSTGNLDMLPMDLPVGPDYVLGPGDGLTINLFGGISQRLRRVVDREGRVVLPEVGGVQVAGRTLGDVQQMVQGVLRTEYRGVQADIALSRVRSVRVYVVGDVVSAGAYEVSSLSTPLNAVYAAGGPSSRGSLRILNHYRGKQLVQRIDVYDLLLHGVSASVQRLEPGDTIQVPPLGAEVTVAGMVRRPAIYELNDETSLAQVLEVAGGVLPSGTLRHVDVERLVAHESRTMLRLDIPESNNQEAITKVLEDFKIQDGDKVQISPILPYAEKTVYLDGYVFRPGKFAYKDGMKVTDLIKSYKDLLPEPYKQHAEIIRLKAPDNTPEVLAFNLDDALGGKDQDLVLQPFDTVRVFGRFNFEDPPIVTVTGEVRDPGDHVTNGAIHLRDAIFMAGNVTPDAKLDDVQVFRKTEDGRMSVMSVDLGRALAGDEKDDVLLAPRDRVFVHKNLAKADPPEVTVQGEVTRPGKYPLGDGMTAAELVRFAGGLKRSAYKQEADLTQYLVENGSRVIGDHRTIQLAAALANELDTDVRLHDGDVLTVRQLSGWNDLGATIQVDGEVAHPGGYGIQPGERLSSIIARAGGFLPNAYPYGSVFERVELREIETKSRAGLIERIRAEAKDVKLLPEMDQDDQAQAQATILQYKKTIDSLENTPPLGRLVIHISSDTRRWANSSADIQVRAGDKIYIPKKPDIVLVDGSVYNPTGITYKPGRSAGWYLKQAGGPTTMANRKDAFVIRADGSVAGGPSGIFSGGVESAEMRPGDMVVVPEKVYSFSTKFKSSLAVAQILSSIGTAASVGVYYATH
jgi:polysaccharide export outer membrane protein